MRIKKLLAIFLSFLLAFSCLFSGDVTALAESTQKMFVISPNSSGGMKYANVFVPLDFLEVDGKRLHSQENDKYYYFKLSFKLKLIADEMPIVGIVRYAYWNNGGQSEFNDVNNNQDSHSDSLLYSTYDKDTLTYTALIRMWINPDPTSGVHTALTIGNMEHNNSWHKESNFYASFAFTTPELYAYDTSTNTTFGGNLLPEITDANFTGNVYKHPQNGYTGSDSLLKAPANKWSIDTTSSLIAIQDIPSGYFEPEVNPHTYVKVPTVKPTETQTGLKEHYICNCGKCDDKYFSDTVGTTVNYEELIIPATGEKKMIVISPNASGESKYANAFIPLTFRESGGVKFNNNDYYFQLSFKAKNMSDGMPIVGITRYAYWNGGSQSEKNYANNNQIAHDDTVISSSYNPYTLTFTAIVKMYIADRNCHPDTGVHSFITIGNMEHHNSYHSENNFYADFAFSDVELYAYNTSTQSTYGENLITGIYESTFNANTTYKFSNDGYAGTDGFMSAPANTWCIDTTSSLVSLQDIPEGYFDPITPDADSSKMLRLSGDGDSEEALSFETKLTAGKTYQFDIDYRAFGGVEPYIYVETANANGFSQLSNYTLTSENKDGSHYSIKFTMPSNAVANNNFKLTIGQKAPIKRNGTVYFANAELYEISNSSPTGENLFTNGNFCFGYPGKVINGNKDTVFFGWIQKDVMSYTDVTVMKIPDGFFNSEKDYSSDIVYEFKGSDMYKPQFDFNFKPNTTYLLSYDYNCDNTTTVNAYIQSLDNSVKAEKLSRISDNKYTATYKITTANTKIYEEYTSANANIRFALNGNKYDTPFYISNIRMYIVDGEKAVGENLIGDLNPIYDSSYYSSLENEGDKTSFTLAKNDSTASSQTVNIGHGWNGNLNYQNYNKDAYANLVMVNENMFTYFSDAERLVLLRKVLLGNSNGYNPYEDELNASYDPNSDSKTNIKDLVRIKKQIADDMYSIPNEQTNGGIYDKVTTVECYGDSITQGMGYENYPEKTYPGQLNTMLGNKYTVSNGGVPSEKTFTIMTRQGALSLFTSKDFSFAKGESTITIGNRNDNGFIDSNGVLTDYIYYLGNQLSINDITIDGEKYTIIVEDFVWSPTRSCTFKLKRYDTSSALTIPQGTPVTLNNTTGPDSCNIYLMGANGHYISTDDLIAQFKTMVDYHGSNNYLIVIPFTNTNYDKKFYEAFGDHCVSFRQAAITYGLEFEGITPTQADKDKIAEGLVPPSLCLNNTYDVHLNEKGYNLLATLLHQQGQQIGIFDTNS